MNTLSGCVYVTDSSNYAGLAEMCHSNEEFPHNLRNCRHCGADCPTLSHLIAHCTSCADNTKLECPACETPFKRKDNLRAHMRNKHNWGEKPICSKCGTVFRSFIKLNLHANQCLDLKMY